VGELLFSAPSLAFLRCLCIRIENAALELPTLPSRLELLELAIDHPVQGNLTARVAACLSLRTVVFKPGTNYTRPRESFNAMLSALSEVPHLERIQLHNRTLMVLEGSLEANGNEPPTPIRKLPQLQVNELFLVNLAEELATLAPLVDLQQLRVGTLHTRLEADFPR